MLAANATADRPLPALVVQQFGNGRTAAIAAGDLWRWGLQRPENREDLEKFWRQSLRWLIADVPDRVFLQVREESGEAGQPET